LHELAQLGEPVRLAGAGVRVHSPPPQVHLFFPAPSGQQPWHAHSRHHPSSISTHLSAQPLATRVSA
jgi:hypothetical protein